MSEEMYTFPTIFEWSHSRLTGHLIYTTTGLAKYIHIKLPKTNMFSYSKTLNSNKFIIRYLVNPNKGEVIDTEYL